MIATILKKVFKYIGIAILVVVTLEVCARVEDWVKWDAPLLGYYSYDVLAIEDEHGRHNRPNAHYEKWRINSLGFRGPEIDAAKPDSVLRVVTVGASETFGLYESPDMEYPMQLQHILDSLHPGKFQVLNAATPGMTPPRIKSFFKSYLAAFEPDFVIYYVQPSVYLDLKPVPETFTPRTDADAVPTFQLRFLAKLRTVLKQFVPTSFQAERWERIAEAEIDAHPKDWLFTTVPPDRMALMEKQLTDMCTTVVNYGASMILSTNASKMSMKNFDPDDPYLISAWRYSPRATKDVIIGVTDTANTIIRSLDSLDSVSIVDAASRMHGQPEYFVDLGHFTDVGARLIAEQMAEEILSQFQSSDQTADLQVREPVHNREGAG